MRHALLVASHFEPGSALHDIALLHDVLEDDLATESELRKCGYSEYVIDTVVELTRAPAQTYADYIAGITSIDAIRVKLADIMENLARPLPKGSLASRYAKAYRVLSYRLE